MSQKSLAIIILLVASSVVFFIAMPNFIALFRSNSSPQVKIPSLDVGNKVVRPPVALPDGPQDYLISSADDVYPRFASAHIDPLKVAVSDTQFMRVVVQDDADVSSVVAEIETDNDVVSVPLKLTGTGALSRSEIMNQKYIVRDGLLVINDGGANALGAADSLVKRAEAQSLKKFTFEGRWIVRDTHVKTYRTKFIAKDTSGREQSITMAWSDPCAGVTDGTTSTLSANCTIGTNTVDGIDNGSINLGGKTLTLSGSGSVFVWNYGKNLTVGTGTISVGTGASLKKTYLWIGADADADGYASGTTWLYGDTCSGCTRRYTTSTPTGDCNDANTSVNPGQTSFFTTATTTNSPTNGAVNFDYNCSGAEDRQYGGLGGCTVTCWITDPTECNSLGGYLAGWSTAPPACGVAGTFVNNCTAGSCVPAANKCFGSGTTKVTGSRTQGCN